MKTALVVALVLLTLAGMVAVSVQASPDTGIVATPGRTLPRAVSTDAGESFTVWFIDDSQQPTCYYIVRQDIVVDKSVSTHVENDCVTLEDATEKLYGLTH